MLVDFAQNLHIMFSHQPRNQYVAVHVMPRWLQLTPLTLHARHDCLYAKNVATTACIWFPTAKKSIALSHGMIQHNAGGNDLYLQHKTIEAQTEAFCKLLAGQLTLLRSPDSILGIAYLP